jgi:hypothetical protein
MTIRFDPRPVLAEHADRAAMWFHPASSDSDGPGLLLRSDTNAIHLTSNGLPAPQPPAHQLSMLDKPAVFARECTPATPWQPAAPGNSEAALCEELTLCAPATNPLLAQLRAGADAGFTTFTVTVITAGLDIAMSRHRSR